jgi:hypothetical protein
MARRDLLAEEGDGATPLMKYGAKTRPGHVAFDDKVATKVRQLKYQRRGEHMLERSEGQLHLLRPPEAGLAKQGGQWCCHRAVVVDETSIIPGEAEERVDGPHRLRHRPLHHRAHLLVIHGHTGRGDDVAKVGHLLATERTLGFLNEELVLA